MTTANKNLAKAIKDRLTEIDVERNSLVALLDLYTNVGAPASAKPASTQKPKRRARGTGFERRKGGPTDRLMAAVRAHPGLPYAEVLDKAMEGMETEAENPRRSLGSTLGSLVKRGKIRRSEDKKYYPGA
jgi:hypothetical protein